jgi:hypothetical protein
VLGTSLFCYCNASPLSTRTFVMAKKFMSLLAGIAVIADAATLLRRQLIGRERRSLKKCNLQIAQGARQYMVEKLPIK